MVSVIGRPQTGKTSPVKTPSAALADMFKALSDPIRLTILRLLRKGELCERDLADLMQMLPQALLAQHLTVLRECGLVRASRDNSNVRLLYYSLDEEVLAELARQCGRLFDTSPIGGREEF